MKSIFILFILQIRDLRFFRIKGYHKKKFSPISNPMGFYTVKRFNGSIKLKHSRVKRIILEDPGKLLSGKRQNGNAKIVILFVASILSLQLKIITCLLIWRWHDCWYSKRSCSWISGLLPEFDFPSSPSLHPRREREPWPWAHDALRPINQRRLGSPPSPVAYRRTTPEPPLWTTVKITFPSAKSHQKTFSNHQFSFRKYLFHFRSLPSPYFDFHFVNFLKLYNIPELLDFSNFKFDFPVKIILIVFKGVAVVHLTVEDFETRGLF